MKSAVIWIMSFSLTSTIPMRTRGFGSPAFGYLVFRSSASKPSAGAQSQSGNANSANPALKIQWKRSSQCWLIFGGLWAGLMHLLFGLLLCITLIGIPWGKQHFKVAGLSLAPFGKDVKLGFYGKKNVSKKRPDSSSYGIWFILPICRNPDFIIAFLGQVYLSTKQLPMKAKYQSVHILTFHHL